MITSKWLGIVAAAFVAGSFAASPELRAYAANTVFSTDIVDGQVKTADLGASAVTAAKIKDGEVKAAEIAADAVGGSELQGVRKLLFGQCTLTSSENSVSVISGGVLAIDCSISGVQDGDSAVATLTQGSSCFDVARTTSGTADGGTVQVHLRNECSGTASVGFGKIAIIVFDK